MVVVVVILTVVAVLMMMMIMVGLDLCSIIIYQYTLFYVQKCIIIYYSDVKFS